MEIKIRNAELRDAKACHEISKIKELLTASGDPISLTYFEDIINDRAIFLVAEIDKEIIGYTSADVISGKMLFWVLLAVKPEFQNKGVGKRLEEEIENECKKRNLKYILGYAPKFNEKTIAFHKKNGFLIGEELVEILKVLD